MSTIASRGKLGIWVENLDGFPGGLLKLIARSQQDGVSRFLFDPRTCTKQDVDSARQYGMGGDMCWSPTWLRDKLGRYPTPQEAAKDVSDYTTALNPTVVMLNVETHDTGWQQQFIGEWRRLRPNRWSTWGFEPRQGPGTVAIQAVLGAGMDIVVETFEGKFLKPPHDDVMVPTDPLREFETWVRSGVVPWERFSLFYDAKLEPTGLSRGILFTSSRWGPLFR
jgi:hypothetical protein